MLPVWKGTGRGIRTRDACRKGCCETTCSNGTESLKTLPLRKDVKGGVKFVKFVGQYSVESVTEDYYGYCGYCRQ